MFNTTNDDDLPSWQPMDHSSSKAGEIMPSPTPEVRGATSDGALLPVIGVIGVSSDINFKYKFYFKALFFKNCYA